MISGNLSAMWSAIALALANHLWQSTFFALATGLLTLTLRKNRARARYWLWLAASVKFLVPFSLLTGLGEHLAWSHSTAGAKAELYFVMEQVSRPFTQATITVPAISRVPSATSSSLIHALPSLFVTAWLCGFLAVLFVWCARWVRIRAVTRGAVSLHDGREMDALRRMERIGGMRQRVQMLSSNTSLEPGIFGIVRPVLIWPQGMSDRLDDAHLEAILAHELWHLRRRDNLAAAIHMLVEAIFWFYPLVWWLGTRLLEERERACDEQGLESGSERQVYAESVLRVCEFCVESPLTCVSGVTGSDLKKRMVNIMTEHIGRKLDLRRKLLLSVAGILAVVLPIVVGVMSATPSRAQTQTANAPAIVPPYQTVLITADASEGTVHTARMMFKPDQLSATGGTLRMLIRAAYRIQDSQVLGEPTWADSERFDIEATVDKSVADELRKLNPDQAALENQRMLQALLADRFKLATHFETRDTPVYVLTIADNGSKLQESNARGLMRMMEGELTSQGFR